MIDDCRLIQNTLTDTSSIDKEIEGLDIEIEVVNGLIRQSIKENSSKALDQDEYSVRYDEYSARYEKLKNKRDRLIDQKEKRNRQSVSIGAFMFEVMELEQPPVAFDEKLWITAVKNATIHRDGRMVFKFTNGAEIEV